jgi:hypothetical protein
MTAFESNNLGVMAAAQQEQARMYFHSRQRAVTVPFWQAIATGGFTAPFLGMLAGLILRGVVKMDILPMIGYSFLTVTFSFLLVSLLAWLYFIVDWRTMYWQTENNVNGGGQTGKPQTVVIEPETVRIEVRNMDGMRGQFVETPRKLTKTKLERFARGIMQGRDITVREWTTEPNKLFSQGEFDTVISFMVNQGWMAYKNREHKNLGVGMTELGRDVMRTFSGLGDYSPTPLEGDE